jgi:Coenzyme PQQ synthesis protein D (PqqD)
VYCSRAMAVVSDATIVVVASDALTADFTPELVILNLRDGVYYGLDEVGARIWALLQTPIAIRAVRDAIASEYDVDVDVCGRDVHTLVGELVERGLVTVC